MLKQGLLSRVIRAVCDIPAGSPAQAQIAITNVCNLECQMCFRYFTEVPYKHMDYEIFKQVIDRLKGIYLITLCGYGEPLLYPKIFEAIRYCRARGFEVALTSNGTLLDEEAKIQELISSGLNSITFSFESIKKADAITHNNPGALKNVKGLIAMKKRMNSKAPLVTLQTLMIKGREEDLFDVIRWGGTNGVDRINVARFEQLNTLSRVSRPDEGEEKIIFKEFAKLRKKYNIQIDCIQDQVFSSLKGFLYKHGKYLLGLDRYCIRLRDFIYIDVDAEVLPCCALNDYKIESLLSKGLRQIWRSKKYNDFRKNYSKAPWCARCDFAKLKQIK